MTYVVWVQVPPPVPKVMNIKEIKNKDKLSIEWTVTIPSTFVNLELDKKYSELKNKGKPSWF